MSDTPSYSLFVQITGAGTQCSITRRNADEVIIPDAEVPQLFTDLGAGHLSPPERAKHQMRVLGEWHSRKVGRGSFLRAVS